MGAAAPAADGPEDAADGDVEAVDAVFEVSEPDAGQQGDDSPSDVRESRPEPFAHTFGAVAHPAEPATSDPAVENAPADDRGTSAASDQHAADRPGGTPES